MDYVQRIRDLREDHDYTQEYVAHVLGTSQTMYARYERAANELPLHHLITLCELYHVSSDYILGLSDTPCPAKKGALSQNGHEKC
jgi:transcriptional regulator with XRE-family HTH domain